MEIQKFTAQTTFYALHNPIVRIGAAIANKHNSIALHEASVMLCFLIIFRVPVFHLEKEHEERYRLTYHLQTKWRT
jgi:hypothetical protein